MADALYIIAKAPRVGFAKTRLGRVIGHEAAVTLYKAFLRDLGARFADAPFECGWYSVQPGAQRALAFSQGLLFGGVVLVGDGGEPL
jgi:hypothetical protein